MSLPVAALGSVLAGAPSCHSGDAVCPDNTVEEDRDDDCPFGPPGGPQRQNSTKCAFTLDATACTKTFRDDVFPILVAPLADRSGGGCTLANCHGPNTQGGAVLLLPEASTPDQLYAALAAFKNDSGDAYIGADDPKAWFICNLRGVEGGGNAMPKPSGLTDSDKTTADDQDLATVEEWVRCGMKLDGIGAGVGGGGVGGAGGAGGN